MKYIFDFDDVLFNNTAQFKKHMFGVIAEEGVPEDEARAYYLKVRENQFSLKDFLTHFSLPNDSYQKIMSKCRNFINIKLIEIVKKLGKENCYIVTNGDQEFNQDKIKYSGIGGLFQKNHIYIVPGTKKEIIKEIYLDNKNEEVIFIEDKVKFIEDIDVKKCPNLKTILYTGQDILDYQ